MVGLRPTEIAAGYDRAAEGYDARHTPAGQRKYHRIEASMRRMLAHGRVLDLGCGTGRMLRSVSPAHRIGADISLEMLRQAPAGLNLVCADSHRLPFADATFDTVIAAQGVVRYLDLARALKEIERVLKPGGHLAAHQFGDVFSFRRLRFNRSKMNLGHFDELTGPAKACGLAVIDVELWRPIRAFPYALKLPSWAPRGIWTHCIALFEKPKWR